MSNHTINEKAFQAAYRAAQIKAERLPNALTSHVYTEEELEILKRSVYRTFLEAYLEVDNM